MAEKPKWTVLYNISCSGEETGWVGKGWEFFDDDREAEDRYHELSKDERYCPTKRPYHAECDYPHLGACHSNPESKIDSIVWELKQLTKEALDEVLRRLGVVGRRQLTVK